MAYRHIALATDLSDEGKVIFEKSLHLAQELGAHLTLVYVDTPPAPYVSELGVPSPFYEEVSQTETIKARLTAFISSTGHSLEDTLICRGDLLQELEKVVASKSIDLMIFGHHQDFWSHFSSSTRQAINALNTDILVTPLRK